MLVKGLDISYDAYKVTPQWCRDRLEEGYTFLIVCLWAGVDSMPWAQRALRYAREAGMETSAYFSINGSHDNVQYHVDKAYLAAGSEWEHLDRVWVGCEIVNIEERHIAQALNSVEAKGKSPGIYTAKWWWDGVFNNPTTFKDYPLWNAHYDNNPDIDFGNYPYGGWTTPYMKQYQGTTNLDGVSVDLDAMLKVPVNNMDEIVKALHVIWKSAELAEAFAKQTKDAVVEIKVALGIN